MVKYFPFSGTIIAIGLAALLPSCSPQIAQETPPSCSMPDLNVTTDHFLNSLVTEDFESAAVVHPNEELLNYAFASPNGLGPISAMNKTDELVAQRLGEYEGGQLILFIQRAKLPMAEDKTYLSSEKFKSFFVCHFICDETWKISSQNTCFEETGSPFHGDY